MSTSPVNTKDWKMGHYPMPERPELDVEGALSELEMFNHRRAAGVLRSALVRSGAIRCKCGDMLKDASVRCTVHPEVRVRTPYERMDFERAFNARIDAQDS